MQRTHIVTGFVIFIAYLLVNLFILNEYGISWDYHYHHYAGLYHLGLEVPSINEKPPVPFSPPDPRLTVEDPFGPFTQVIPSLSQVIFADRLGILPFDAAYNLPMVIFGAIGVFALYLFLLEAFGFFHALIGSIFLALNPIYFGYLHNNMKDIPNAVLYTLSLYTFWRLVRHRRISDLITASLAFAIAFNIKINSVFIPVICLLFLFLSGDLNPIKIIKNRIYKKNYFYVIFLYFPISLYLAIIVWWPFWKDPLGKLLELPKFYSLNTYNMPVLFLGKIIRSGINIPFSYPYVYLFISIPVVIIAFFLPGLVMSFIRSYKNDDRYKLILLWFFVPLLRYLSPKAGAIDGVRHFMEVLFPLSVISSIGFVHITKKIKIFGSKKVYFFSVFLVSGLLINILIHIHPYQTSYFNFLIGGTKGASRKFDIDFWGTPQREAVVWLNKNAPRDSYVHIIMAQSSNAMYLRDDLRKNANVKDKNSSDYTVILNRKSFFILYGIDEYMNANISKTVYKREIDGVPLVWVIKN